jgi:hypothetical protein
LRTENRVLRRILGPKRDKVMGQWRKLQNKEFQDLYSSPSTIRIIKSRRMISEGYVAGMEEEKEQKKKDIGYWWKFQKERTTKT